VKGVKPGFVGVGNQEWQEWIEAMVAKAARYHLMVDIHDAYRPTGFSRTYPNLLTQEGIRGNEHAPNADHDAMLPFTRYTCGAGDYTPGYLRGDLQSTFAHRLALPILYYSPAQFLFWREHPDYNNIHPELALWNNIPTTWDDTKVLSGTIGEEAVIARRSGTTWYVGGITNTNARTLSIDYSFLTPGKRYEAILYTDDPTSRGRVKVEKKNLTARDHLTFPLLGSGGFAMRITIK
jgi:alpha-glucosidase